MEFDMKDILVIGAGKIGQVVAELLARSPGAGYRVTVADRSTAATKKQTSWRLRGCLRGTQNPFSHRAG
jgi:saccharopine dehydrogenase-like NADP-dependent oxidoreductase